MDPKNFVFYPPPPPPPRYNLPKPPPPPPPESSNTIQPPSMNQNAPFKHTSSNWGSWSGGFDFSRPPPILNSTTPYRVKENSNRSSHFSQDNPNVAHYGINNQDNINYSVVSPNKQYSQKRYRTSDSYNTAASNQHNWSRNRNFKQAQRQLDGRVDSPSSSSSYNKNIDSRSGRTISDFGYPKENDLIESNHEELHNRSKKRKKPLSLAVPAKKAWTDEEAQMAINVEKEYNKLFKNHSLKIEFPDQELNREIVSKFHSSIETVFFQQPSKPRFCFVTLAEGVDPNGVIEELNKIKFGLGYLSVEYKKDREEEQNVGREDIDPLTLYVGNLAQDVTKEDMVNFYPNNKRIDIGYAKKMKYTRYAFVTFRTVQDAIEAFKATHYADLHSKSMIVRFRRLHGTVGMPGEPKIQSPFKKNPEGNKTETDATSNLPLENHFTDATSNVTKATEYPLEVEERSKSVNETLEISHDEVEQQKRNESQTNEMFDPSLVKSEPRDYSDSEFDETSGMCSENLDSDVVVKKEPEFISPFLPEMPNIDYPVRPILLKVEPNENDETVIDNSNSNSEQDEIITDLVKPKTEIDNDNSEPVDPDNNEEEFNTTTDFGSVLDNLVKRPRLLP